MGSWNIEVLIPTYNNLHELQECIAGLQQQQYKSFRAIVCIDGSTDGSKEWLEAIAAEVAFPLLILEHPDGKNHGRNPTRNLALPHLQAQYLCFLDSDVVPSPQLLAEHLRLLQQHDDRGVSVGDIRYTNARQNAWAAYTQTRGKNKYPDGTQIPYYYLTTGNCAHATEYFLRLGGQDAHITRYGGGDTEYAIRLYKAHTLPVFFNARAFGESEMNKSLETALQQMEEFGRTNLHYIQHKHPDVEEIFGLSLLKGKSLHSRFLRLLMHKPLAALCAYLVPYLPAAVSNTLLNYCVITRIAAGWKKGK